MKKKKTTTAGKAKTARKRSAAKDLTAKKAGAVKGGLLPASQLLPAVQSTIVGDGSVRTISSIK